MSDVIQTIWLTPPPADRLIAYVFERYPDCHRLMLWRGTQEDLTFEEIPHPERTEGTTMNFSADYLWDLLKADQMVLERAHRGREHLLCYVDPSKPGWEQKL